MISCFLLNEAYIMLRLIQVSSQLPVSFPVDPTSTFEPGNIAQMKTLGNEIVCGLSDGTAPLGIIDDINANAFSANSIDEVVLVNCVGVSDGYGSYVAATNTKEELNFPNIITSSFVSDVEGLTLNGINGVITVPAGTTLNYDSDGDGINDSVRAIVSYAYRIANIPGDNTTVGSGRITIWFGRGIFETDKFDPQQKYAVNAALFCDAEGRFTTKQPSANHPGIAMVTGPPTGINPTLELMWF